MLQATWLQGGVARYSAAGVFCPVAEPEVWVGTMCQQGIEVRMDESRCRR